MDEDETPTAPTHEPQIDPQLQQEPVPPQTDGSTATKKAPAKRRAPAKRKRKTHSAGAVEQSGDEGQAGDGQEGATQRRKAPAKKGRKRKSRASATTTGEGTEEEGDQVQDGPVQGEEEEEESDPELHEIDPNKMTIYDLARAKKYGKTSEREKKMAEINWDEVVAKRREAEEKALEQAEEQERQRREQQPGEPPIRKTTEGRNGPAGRANQQPDQPDQQEENQEENQEEPQEQSDQPEAEGGLRFKIVNGQIVEDESTLTIPNQSQVQAEADAAATEAIEENDLTVRINNASYLNSRKRDPVERHRPAYRNKSDPWTEEETERFYGALKMFGTDFLIISKMFPGKTRPQIKSKFIREERLDLERVNNALLGRDTAPRTPMNLEHYAKESGRQVSDFTKYTTHEQAMASIKEDMREREEEVRQKLAKAEEDKRQAEVVEREARDANKKKRGKKGEGTGKGKGKKKGGGGGLGGGGPVESVEAGD